MPPVGIEPIIPESKQTQSYVLEGQPLGLAVCIPSEGLM